MVYVKETFKREHFEEAFLKLWEYIYTRHIDISKPENMIKALSQHFEAAEVAEIMKAATSPKYKQALNDNTQKVMDLGAFGAPWFWVRNSKGNEEPFFGSDR